MAINTDKRVAEVEQQMYRLTKLMAVLVERIKACESALSIAVDKQAANNATAIQ